jgi:methyltransferase (TIGR00027 family)
MNRTGRAAVKSGRPSKTAEHNALFRALEARRSSEDRVVEDLLAEDFLPWRFKLVTVPARWRPWRDAVTRFIDRRWPGVRPTVIARTRLIDQTIAEIVSTTPQVVILGAGFDTRAWRLAALEAVVVFEVDHPDTQRRKQALLRRRHLDGVQVRFIPTDFNLGRLAKAMTDAGFDRTLPTLFLWEGTTNYLEAEAVDATLRWCAQAAAGSHLIFTYINEDVLIDPGRYVGADRVFSTVRRANEPMTFGLAPEALAEYLAERGLQLVSDVSAASFRQQAYGAASATMRGHEFYRVAHAYIAAK